MKNKTINTLYGYVAIALLGALFFTSCVSVKLGDSSAKKSDRFSFVAPSSDFRALKDKSVDLAWMKRKTGSTLSVRTKCQKGLDMDLGSWIVDLSESLNSQGQDIRVDKIQYNDREAVQSIFDSQIEGFDNKLAVTTFIKNSCHYIIALTALSSNFEQDLPEYQRFLQGFKAW